MKRGDARKISGRRCDGDPRFDHAMTEATDPTQGTTEKSPIRTVRIRYNYRSITDHVDVETIRTPAQISDTVATQYAAKHLRDEYGRHPSAGAIDADATEVVGDV